MSIKERILKRKAKAEEYVNGNRIFVIFVAIVIIALVIGNITEKNTKTEPTESKAETAEETETSKEKDDGWQFYWSDLIIFVTAGGFCTFKILQEKRRAKEELR